IQVLLIRGGSGLRDPVGIVEHDAEIADAPDAGFRADRRQAGLDARIAEGAFLRFAGFPVVVDLLVGAAGDAHAPAPAFVLVDEDDAVLLPLVDGAGGAGRDAGRVAAVLAQPRQVHQEGVLELPVDFLLGLFEIGEIVVGAPLLELAAQDLLPVRPPIDPGHALAGDDRDRARRRRRLGFGRMMEIGILEIERLVVVVDFRQIRVGEDVGQDPPLAAHARLDPAVRLPIPAALPAALVLPVLRIADARLALDVVEPGVLDPLARGPYLLAGHRAGMAPDALVEVQDLADLCSDLHSAASPRSTLSRFSASGRSRQSPSLILRMM